MYFNSFVICLALNKIYQLGKLEFFLGGGDIPDGGFKHCL